MIEINEINTMLIRYMTMIKYAKRIKKDNMFALSLSIYRVRKNDQHRDDDFLESSQEIKQITSLLLCRIFDY